jgi:curved DNA-binding protein CbpA
MVIELKTNSSKAEIKEAYKKISKQTYKPLKGFDTKKFAGKLKRGFDGMEYQKMVRNEWE